VLVLAAMAMAAPSHADTTYTLADLRALAQQQSWPEIVDHLSDIPPASRDAEWQTIAQQAGLGALNMAGQRGPTDGLYLSESLLTRYPVLKTSPDFMSKRASLGAQAFQRCFARDEWAEYCAARLRPFVQAEPTNQELAFRLGKLVPPRAYGRLAVPAFAVAIRQKDDPRCQDPDVRRAVLSGLSLPRAGNEDTVAESVQLGSTLCWQALAPAIVERMGSDAPDYLANTCPFAKQKQALPDLLAKRCDAINQTAH
jgi:hypothetical protein